MNTKRCVLIQWEGGSVQGELNETETATQLWSALPIRSIAHRWGDEVYFNVGIHSKLDRNATDVVPPGTICFWVEGSSVAIPFGRTPVSRGNECRLVTRVNIIGQIVDDCQCLSTVQEGMEILMEKCKEEEEETQM